MREQRSSRLRISIPISSTASWSCPERSTCLAQPPRSSHLLCCSEFTFGGCQTPKIQCLPFFADEAHTCSGDDVCAKSSFLSLLSLAHKGWAQLSSFAAALITHNCSLLGWEIFVAYPCLLSCLSYVHQPSTPSPQRAGTDTQETLETGRNWKICSSVWSLVTPVFSEVQDFPWNFSPIFYLAWILLYVYVLYNSSLR